MVVASLRVNLAGTAACDWQCKCTLWRIRLTKKEEHVILLMTRAFHGGVACRHGPLSLTWPAMVEMKGQGGLRILPLVFKT